jgi:lipid-A-disaccharide synthase
VAKPFVIIIIMIIYFVAGEASGDNHGAELMRSLRKREVDLEFTGRGGPQMKAIAGEQFQNWIGESSVLGLWEVIRRYGYFRREFHATLREIETIRPDAVVLIDYPGFNLRLARAVRREIDVRSVRRTQSQSAEAGKAKNDISAGSIARSPTFHPKIIYYISPQVWAWHRGRIKKMARFLDLMLCIFSFEAELYNKSGLRASFVGHPMVDRLRDCKIKTERDPCLIGLFPGSRSREVARHFPIMLETVRELFRAKQTLRFEIAAASEALATEISDELAAARLREGLFRVVTGETAATMQRASVGIVASGSATLEAAYFRLPFVLIYRVAWPTYLAGRLVVKVKYLGMPNLLAKKEIVREFIQHRAKPKAIAKAVLRLLHNPAARKRMISEFDQIVPKLGEAGASKRAATAILEEIDKSSDKVDRGGA